jgi:hypothetical protein
MQLLQDFKRVLQMLLKKRWMLQRALKAALLLVSLLLIGRRSYLQDLLKPQVMFQLRAKEHKCHIQQLTLRGFAKQLQPEWLIAKKL